MLYKSYMGKTGSEYKDGEWVKIPQIRGMPEDFFSLMCEWRPEYREFTREISEDDINCSMQ